MKAKEKVMSINLKVIGYARGTIDEIQASPDC
jgi:hypothetical protein